MDELKKFLNAQINSGTPSELNIPLRIFSIPGISEENKGDGQPMVDESSQEEKWEPLQQLRDGTFFDTTDIKKKDAAKLPRELIQDFQEDYTEEQRQNLYEKILEMGIPEKLHLAIFANRETRKLLIRDPNKMIALNVLKNAKVNENEVLQYAKRRDLSQDIILAIAQDQKWKKNYLIKLALVSNPKTPLLVALYFLSHLHEKDLKSLSRDQNVSSVLRWHAQQILLKKK
jgi:hypothetical protein